MSADLYDSEDKLKSCSCEASMNVHGHLFLTCYEGEVTKDHFSLIATCAFQPDEIGFAEAEKLAAALLEWVRHNKG